MNLCMAVPFLAAPLIGGCVQWFGFWIPFASVSAVIAMAAMLTWTMDEPRA